ncbi:ABC transporter ATP-binding protein [Ottowia testudinis]|uniref:ABC transporter ATP-binding protein n=1 Tax=Ottowia testudinis TaxID=2816950 RepID=A0A975H4X1_9BURK|nr:ABC transporter ATP-binding protein [Ottowia testudinis]QTD44357.1 ABC transporter ATP-binding protein [Ottowia testudinis]
MSTTTATTAPAAPRAGVTPWRTLWQQLMRSAASEAPALRRALFGLMAAALLQGLALACLLPLFDALLPAPHWGRAWPWLVVWTALALAVQVLRWRALGFDYHGHMATMTHQLRTQLGEQLRRMPLLKLQDKRAGEMNAHLLGSVDENLNYTVTIFNFAAQAVLTPLAAALVLMFWDWRLGLAMLLVFPALIPMYRWRMPAFGRGFRILAQANARASGDILEYSQGLPVLRAARSEGARAQRLQESFAHLENVQVIGQQKGSKPNVIIASVVEVGLLLVMAAGVAWVVQGSLSVAVLAAVFVMLTRFAEPLATFISFMSIFQLIETALERVAALLAIEPLAQAMPVQIPTRYDIAFDGVDFRYAQDASPVLQGFSAHMPAHSLTALVGPSGGGKTTVTRLLMRHADPQAGRVTIGGVDVRAIAPEVLNSLVSVVFQDVYLFDDTVLNNIRMARLEASDDEVREAARAAQCLDFIERLPHGWNTRIGEIGGRLSGGERQRISIARALLKNAPIVVLDEPTAALDTESEVAVQRAIEALVQNKTVIVIAHRLSTIAGAQQILVIDQGRALEHGKHAELITHHGRYAALWKAQQSVKQWRVSSTST